MISPGNGSVSVPPAKQKYCRLAAALPDAGPLPRPQFGLLAQEMFCVDRGEVERAVAEHRASGRRIGEVLRQRGVLDREQTREILRCQARWTTASACACDPGFALPWDVSLSLCLPAYNEADVLEDTLDGACAILPEFVRQFEIVVADDGSRDATPEILARYASAEPRVRAVTHPHNLGYGAAVSSAFRAARCDLVCLLDSDGQFNLLDLPRFLARFPESDMAIGYRKKRADRFLRVFNAWAWNKLNRLVLGVAVRDIDCAFKVLHRQTVESLRLGSRGACISAEILTQCISSGLKIAQVPVEHYPRSHGSATGGLASVIGRAFREFPSLVPLRWSRIPKPDRVRFAPAFKARRTGCRENGAGSEKWQVASEKCHSPLPTPHLPLATCHLPLPPPPASEVPMTVCMLAACPFPANHGTPGSIREMAEAIAQRGHDVHVVTYHMGDDTPLDGVQLHRISPWTKEKAIVVGPTVRRPLYDLQMVFKTLEVIRTHRPAVLHAHGYEAMLAAWLCRLWSGVPVVYSGHNTMADELPSYNFFRPRWIATALGRVLDYFVPRMADRRIPHSENMAAFFRQEKLHERTEFVIPFGINLESVARGDAARLRAAYGLTDEPVVLYAGVLNQFQRLDLLIDAMPGVVRRFPAAKLMLVTTIRAAALEEELRRRAEAAGVADRLIITEPQSLRSVQELLSVADVAVTPRIDEPGFPIKLLNYMAAGKASVAYESSARGLEHKRHAYLAAPNTPEALGDAIAEVLGDSDLRARLKQHGHEYVCARHDRRLIAQRIVEVYLRTVLQTGSADSRALLWSLPSCNLVMPVPARCGGCESTTVST